MSAPEPAGAPPDAILVGEGSSAQVYAVGANEVVKLFRPGVGASLVDREYTAARLAASLGLRVAEPLERSTSGGREMIRYRRVQGPTLLGTMTRQAARTLPTMLRLARLHAQIHAQPVGAELRAQVEVLRRDIVAGPAAAELKGAALAALKALGRGDRLCHGDLHPGNVIDTPQGLTLIDWSKASVGHPAADAARTELLLRFAPLQGTLSRLAFVRFGRWLAAQAYLRGYLWHAGLRRRDVLAWHLPVAVAWMRARPGRAGDGFERYVERLAAQARAA